MDVRHTRPKEPDEGFPGAVAQLADRREGAEYIEARLADWSAARGFWYVHYLGLLATDKQDDLGRRG